MSLLFCGLISLSIVSPSLLSPAYFPKGQMPLVTPLVTLGIPLLVCIVWPNKLGCRSVTRDDIFLRTVKPLYSVNLIFLRSSFKWEKRQAQKFDFLVYKDLETLNQKSFIRKSCRKNQNLKHFNLKQNLKIWRAQVILFYEGWYIPIFLSGRYWIVIMLLYFCILHCIQL